MDLRFFYRALKARYRDQRREIEALLGALRPDDIAIDVGAYKGSYLYWLSRAVPRGRVIAFEPQPALGAYLKRICRAMRLENVVVEPCGVSDHDGTLTLHIPSGNVSPGASFGDAVTKSENCRTVDVAVRSLDGYCEAFPQRVGAIKIDAEGHELAVFRGARRILTEHSPLLVFECENRHLVSGTVMDVLSHLRDLGYDGWFIQGSRLVRVSEFSPLLHQKQEGERFWDAKDYCNNFIMQKRTGRK